MKKKKEKQKKKADRKAEEAKTDLPDISEVYVNSDSDTDEEDSPGRVRKDCMDPEIYKIKIIKYTDQDILTSLDKAKAAKECMEQVTTLYGTISDDPRTTGPCTECFLPDTGATLNIIGLEVAKDNGLKITKLTKTRRIAEASGIYLGESPKGRILWC